jgi:hypothetical protein
VIKVAGRALIVVQEEPAPSMTLNKTSAKATVHFSGVISIVDAILKILSKFVTMSAKNGKYIIIWAKANKIVFLR